MALSEATMNEKENKPGQRAANKGFGKKLGRNATSTFRYSASVISSTL
jgi:hypothetical protein